MSVAGSRVWIAGLGALLACAGCGFKGPLYLPERNATVVTHPAGNARGAPAPGQEQTPATKSKSKTSQPSQPSSPPPTSPP